MAYTLLTPPKPRDRLIKPSEYIDEAPPGCVLWLKNRRSDKIWYDESGHGNHGTINGATWTAKGRRGPSLSFDGTDDYVNCGNDDSLNITDAITITLWVNVILPLSSGGIVAAKDAAGGRAWSCYIRTDGTLYFIAGNGSGADPTSVSVTSGEWSHIAYRYISSTIVQYFIDGVMVKQDSTVSAMVSTNTDVYIGGRSYVGLLEPIKGLIDQVLIFNRALSAAEIRALYEQGR